LDCVWWVFGEESRERRRYGGHERLDLWWIAGEGWRGSVLFVG
jgi:hypothetical protein